jgi:two-component system sensor histidine kinase KdpD
MRIDGLRVKKELGPFTPYVATLLAVGATFVVVAVIEAWVTLPTALLLYLVPVVLAAARWGRGPAVVAAITSVLGHDLFFVQPYGTLTVARADEAMGLALLLFVALVTAGLADAARRGAIQEREAQIARQSDELKKALLHTVSHDLRTPLASIKAAASGLRQSDATYTDEDRAELLAAIEEESDRLERLVRNLLDASRLEAGALQPHKQWQDVAELVRAVVDRLQPLLRGRSVQIDAPDDLPLVACDYGQIDQVVSNLLENAARHTPPGTPVCISLEAEDGGVAVTVADSGPGIASSERERLFRPFERGRTRAQGSGLGLAIARGLVEAHGGRLSVADAPGGGAAFEFWLPQQ